MKQLFKLSFLFVLLWLSSCATRRDILYLQDMDELKEYPVVQKYEAVIQRDDKLNIKVTSKNPELALAFNLPGVGGYTVDAQGADVVEVYYKPNIDICVDLIDSKGNKVTEPFPARYDCAGIRHFCGSFQSNFFLCRSTLCRNVLCRGGLLFRKEIRSCHHTDAER